jgi:hypothetical protein
MRKALLVVSVVACVDLQTPLSLDLHYAADAPRLPQLEKLSGLKIGVARFFDGRKNNAEDPHSPSYVAHDKSYHMGVSYGGRTFASISTVVQGLLVKELTHAGLNVVALDAQLDGDDVSAAQAAAQQCDLVMGGLIRNFAFNHSSFDDPEPTVDIEATAFAMPDGVARFHGHYLKTFAPTGYNEPPRQERIDSLFDRGLRPAAHQLIVELGRALAENGQ